MAPEVRSSRQLFLIISLMIFVSDGLFVWINYLSSRQALETSLAEEMNESIAAFRLTMEITETMLQQTVSFVANDQRVQQLFLRGKRAVAAEGGGAGGEQARKARQDLLDLVGPGWDAMQQRYQVRQLHFHLGPGSTSFLRVHRPEKFGDNMDDVRYTIVDANTYLETTHGFETGRVYSGIRGVTPVFAVDQQTGNREHVGALEAGTSFPPLLQTLQDHSGTHFAILLTTQHMRANVWPSFLERLYQASPEVGGYFVEASSGGAAIRSLLGNPDLKRAVDRLSVTLLNTETGPISVGAFPLRDYKGGRDASRPDAGRILIWRDATTAVGAFQETLYINLAFSVVAFVLLEALLFFGIRAVTNHLEQTVTHRTRELADANATLKLRNVELVESLDNLSRTRHVLAESEKMASIGRLVAGVAHEVNTPVGSGMTAASHLVEKIDEFSTKSEQGGLTQSDLSRFLDVICRSSSIVMNNLERAAKLVRGFKQLAVDRSSEAARTFQLCRYIDKVILSLQPQLDSTGHSIHISCNDDLTVYSYPGALSQVLSNLILNSLKHAFAPDTAGNIFISLECLADNRLRLVYRDDGSGIPEADRSKIFEPLFTTRRDVGGSGLGLSIVYNLVNDTLGGSIVLDQGFTEGAAFIIEFPIRADS